MNIATDSPFIEFVHCGKMGALELGISRAETIARLGAPKDWFGKLLNLFLLLLEMLSKKLGGRGRNFWKLPLTTGTSQD
jgi:hypothetical protein